MSGKSTLLRSIGLNAVLAQAGASGRARQSLTLPPADLETSIRVQDSLELGLSYFMAALARLKGVLDRAASTAQGRVVLYLLDEILQGTNTVERAIAVRGVARHLLDAGAIGVMTTHDLGLAGGRAARHGGAAGPLHRDCGRARRYDLRLPAAARPGDLPQRAAADAADRDW